jgi:hypothetical protein
MKLRTSLTASRDGSLVDATDENLIQDAAAAHALMMALERWAARRADHASYADHLLGHADEIIAQWGFDTGEDSN